MNLIGLSHLRDFLVYLNAANITRSKDEGVIGVLIIAEESSGKSQIIISAAKRFLWRIVSDATKNGINKLVAEIGIRDNEHPAVIAIPPCF